SDYTSSMLRVPMPLSVLAPSSPASSNLSGKGYKPPSSSGFEACTAISGRASVSSWKVCPPFASPSSESIDEQDSLLNQDSEDIELSTSCLKQEVILSNMSRRLSVMRINTTVEDARPVSDMRSIVPNMAEELVDRKSVV